MPCHQKQCSSLYRSLHVGLHGAKVMHVNHRTSCACMAASISSRADTPAALHASMLGARFAWHRTAYAYQYHCCKGDLDGAGVSSMHSPAAEGAELRHYHIELLYGQVCFPENLQPSHLPHACKNSEPEMPPLMYVLLYSLSLARILPQCPV